MATTEEQELIKQLTLNKLALVQALLKRKDLARSGTRENVRAYCIKHLDDGKLRIDELKALLESLDLWGNQRIRFIRVNDRELLPLQDEDAIRCVVEKAGFTEIYDQELPLIAEAQVSPISIRYKEANGKRTLFLIAGKIQEDWKEIDTLPELAYELVAALLYEYDILDTDIIFRPFLRQRRKIVSFAEIDLESGHGLMSVKTSATAGSYTAKFDELCCAFDPLLRLTGAETVNLRKAISLIDDPSSGVDVKLPAQHMREDDGASLKMQATSGKGDVRQYARFQASRQQYNTADSGDYCDSYWNPCDGLTSKVHCCIYGPAGEVGIRGQASEEDISYVLQRIRQLNS